MKINNIKISVLVLGLLMVVSCVMGQAPYTVKEVKMTVSGTSTLHEWVSEVTKVDWVGSLKVTANTLDEVKDVIVKIPVTSIKSTKGRIMDNKTYDAFNYEKYPTIQYKLSAARITGAGSDFTINASGNLTMAGKTKPVDLVVKAKVQANGDVLLTASKKLNMKDFSMEPPTAMMGAITVGEEITVAFTILVHTNSTNNL